MSCPVYKKLESTCNCIFKYEDSCGNIGSVNLHAAKVIPLSEIEGGVHIYGTNGSFKGILSNCTLEEIEALICDCAGGGGPSGDEDDPLFVDLSASMVSCAEVVTESIPVRVVCSDIEQVQLACTEDGQLLYLDVTQFPPIAFTFDGTQYTGNVVPCERELIQHFEDYCNDDGVYTKITCVNKLDPTDVQITWLFEGEVVDPPTDVERCEDVCDPHVSQFNGDPENTEPYNKINVFTPKCCTSTITTSAGTFSSFGGQNGSNFCLDWECNLDPEITITIDDETKLDQVITTIQRSK